jgi:predicted CxxxxCH...CXXCH cytochrome family protein
VPDSTFEPGHVDTALPAELTWGVLATADGAMPSWDGANCAGVYCHGSTLSGGTNTTPAWTVVDGSQDVCGACHGLPPDPPHSASTLCGVCHGAVADNTPAITAAGAALHINGTVEVAGTHCNSCHGDSGSDAPPVDTEGNTATTARGVGAHRIHLAPTLTTAVACAECHVVPSALDDAGHIDSVLPAEVTFAAGPRSSLDGATPVWNAGALRCEGTYCHGATLAGGTATAPVWTTVDGSQASCGSCHGSPPSPGHPSSALCGRCHAAVADDTPSVVNAALHVDGTVAYDLTDGPCTAAGCHDTGVEGWPNTGHHDHHRQEGMWCTDCHFQYAGTGTHYDGTDQSGTGIVIFDFDVVPAGAKYDGVGCTGMGGAASPCHGSEGWWP